LEKALMLSERLHTEVGDVQAWMSETEAVIAKADSAAIKEKLEESASVQEKIKIIQGYDYLLIVLY
jgi:hypothetical protein